MNNKDEFFLVLRFWRLINDYGEKEKRKKRKKVKMDGVIFQECLLSF